MSYEYNGTGILEINPVSFKDHSKAEIETAFDALMDNVLWKKHQFGASVKLLEFQKGEAETDYAKFQIETYLVSLLEDIDSDSKELMESYASKAASEVLKYLHLEENDTPYCYLNYVTNSGELMYQGPDITDNAEYEAS